MKLITDSKQCQVGAALNLARSAEFGVGLLGVTANGRLDKGELVHARHIGPGVRSSLPLSGWSRPN